MTKKQKNVLIRIIISALLTILLSFLPIDGVLKLVIYSLPYLIIGYDILKKAFWGISDGQLFDENFLMASATIGAVLIAFFKTGDYTEAIAVMLFYQVGELFQSYAVGKSRKNIAELMDIRPDYANTENDGRLVKTDPDKVEIGSIIIVNPGEKVPIDGVIASGSSALDMSALTGESIPRDVFSGDEVLSGSINLSGVLKIKTTREFSESTASKILDLVENASSKKSKSEAFISRFARIYTPAVCFFALAIAIIPPLISLALGNQANLSDWLYRALTFLVVSCPCALVISIPLSFFAGLGGASSEGILIKGSNYLEALSKVSCLVFDKTGTLTEGAFEVTEVCSARAEEKELIEYAALAETASSHPISRSLKAACEKELDTRRVKNIREISGKGVVAEVDGKEIAVGNDRLMKDAGVKYEKQESSGTIVHVAAASEYLGYIVISDKVKKSSVQLVSALKKAGVKKTVMLTGDIYKEAEAVSKAIGIDDFYAELLPQDKVNKVEELLFKLGEKEKLAFAGDGINDAPVLARADVGIAMGAIGSDSALEAADVVLMDDDPLKIVKAIKISQKCLRIVYTNSIFAIGVKLICLLFAAFGMANMWLAIFADVGVMVIAVLNAVRALRVKNL